MSTARTAHHAHTTDAVCMLQGQCVAWQQEKEKGSHIPFQSWAAPHTLKSVAQQHGNGEFACRGKVRKKILKKVLNS